MKKTYKPHSKQNKQVNSYRKKTIDPGVDLNLKKDDDNMENIDDYWHMAEYVMDEDKTSNEIKNIPKEAENLVKKKKDTDKFKKNEDKKQSFFMENMESSVINEVMDISTDGSKLTGDYKETLTKPKSKTLKKSSKQKNEDTSGEDTLFDIDNIRESLSHSALKKKSEQTAQSNTLGLEFNNDAGSLNETSFSSTNKTESTPKKTMKNSNKEKKSQKKEPMKKGDKLKKENDKSDLIKTKKDNVIESIVTKKNAIKKANKNDATKISKKKNDEAKPITKKKRSSVTSSYDFKGEHLMGKNNKLVGLTKITSLFQGRSKLEPLITKKSLESGILFLKSGASIVGEKADVCFTIFILKGTIEISIDNVKFKVGRESCLYVEEGSLYDIIDKSNDGSSLFVTFKSK